MTTVTIGANDYNVYADPPSVTIFASADLTRSATWEALSLDDQNKACVMATRMLDRQDWAGTKADADQALEFPRSGQTEIPARVLQAFQMLAVDVGVSPTLVDKVSQQDGVKRVKAGSAEVEKFAPSQQLPDTPLPRHIWNLIKNYIASSTGSTSSVGCTDVNVGEFTSMFPARSDIYEGW